MGNIIKTAEQYKGYGPYRFTHAYGVPDTTPWCCIFVWYVFKECGASKLFYNGQKTAYCPTAYLWCKQYTKRVSIKDAKAGDVIFFDWNGNGSPDHIGFVKKSGNASSVITIEGNTGGNKVAEQVRYSSYILGIFRPAYTSSQADTITINRRYKVVNPNGAPVRRGASKRYKQVATIPYGTVIDGKELYKGNYVLNYFKVRGWTPIKEGKTIYLHII